MTPIPKQAHAFSPSPIWPKVQAKGWRQDGPAFKEDVLVRRHICIKTWSKWRKQLRHQTASPLSHGSAMLFPSLSLFVSKMGATGRPPIATGNMRRMMESARADAYHWFSSLGWGSRRPGDVLSLRHIRIIRRTRRNSWGTTLKRYPCFLAPPGQPWGGLPRWPSRVEPQWPTAVTSLQCTLSFHSYLPALLSPLSCASGDQSQSHCLHLPASLRSK